MKKKLLWIITLVIALCFMVVATACDDEPSDPPPPATYTVTVPTTIEGGTVTASATTVTAGEKVTLTVTTEEGYTLTSVKVNDEQVALSNGKYEFTPTANATVTASFSAIKYDITYIVEGGTLPEGATTSYTVKDGEITLPTPTRTGSDFLGWYDADYANEFTKIEANAKGNKTFYALWELSEYDIAYDLSLAPSSVTNPNTDTTYNIDDEIELLPLPDTAEKVFKGWQFADGEPVTVLGNGMTGAVTVKAIYEDRGIFLDGAIDASWASYENARVIATGAGTTITAYERIVNGGVFIELRIEHNSAIVTGNSPSSWWLDSYVATFLAGQNVDEYVFKPNTTELLSKNHQYQFASEHNPKWDFAKMTTTGNATDGFVTIIELYEGLSDIVGYNEGDEFVRVGLGVAWFNGNKNEVRVVRGQYGNNGLSSEQKYYENGYFVTEEGAFALDPTKYHITINDGENGTVTAPVTEFETENTAEATLTVTANEGYELDTLTVGGQEVTALVQNGEYNFTPAKYITEVVATWKTITYTVEYAGIPQGVTNANSDTTYTVEDNITFIDLEDTETQIFIGWKESGDWVTSTEGKTGNLTITAVYENIVMASASGTVKSASYTLGSTPYALDSTFSGTVSATCTASEYEVIVGKTYAGTIGANGAVTFERELPVGTYSITVNAVDYKETTASLTVAESGANAFEAVVAYRTLTNGSFEEGAYSVSRGIALSSANEKYNGATFIEATISFNGALKLNYECAGGIVATGTGTIGHGASGNGFNVYLINTAYATNPQGTPDKIRIGRHNYNQVTSDVALSAEDINPDGSVTLTVVRYDGTWYVYANGNFKQAFDGDALLGGTSWQVGIQGEARDITATDLAISGNEQLVSAFVTSKTDILMDGKLDDGWTNAMKQTLTGTDSTYDVYARLTDAGLYSEIVINHTTFVTDKSNWYENSYLASFIAGAHYSSAQSVQHAFTPVFAKMNGTYISYKINHKDNGDGTHSTVIETFKPYSTINGYTAGDKFVRMSMGFAWWNGASGEVRFSTGYASTMEQKYYDNGYYISESGISRFNPEQVNMDGAVNANLWENYSSAIVTNETNAGQKITVYSRLVDYALYAEVKIVHTGAVVDTNFNASDVNNTWWKDSYIATFITGANESALTFKDATTKQLNGVHQHRWTAADHITNWNYTNSKTTYDEGTQTYTTVVELVKLLKNITGYTAGDAYVRMGMGIANFESGKTSYITTNATTAQDMLDVNYYVTVNGLLTTAPTQA